jgi:hypothetical protein
VATKPKSLRLQFDADARLAAAVGGAARYLADASGLENDATAQFQNTVIAACLESFDHLTGSHPQLEVTLTRFADRIEVALSFHGESSPALGLDTLAGFAAQAGEKERTRGVFAGVDRVQYESREGSAVTRLTKYFGELTPRI